MDEAKAECDLQEASTSGNVRGRVSTWLSGIVDEVRRKSPVPLQQWTTKVPATDKSNISPTSTEETSSIKSETIDENTSNTNENLNEDNQNKVNVPIHIENKNDLDNKKFWSKDKLFSKINESFDKFTENEDNDITTASKLRSISRAKINEFYDKVRINKERYNLYKTKRSNMDTSHSLSISKNKINNLDESESLSQQQVISNNQWGHDSSREQQQQLILDSEQSDNTNNSQMQNNDDLFLKIGGSTYRCRSELNSTLNRLSFPTSSPKNIKNLGNIGRSISEQNDDDEDDDSFLPSERSRRYSNVINERTPNININNNNSNSNNNVSSSLPSFFGHKSRPVSPIPQVKAAMSRETSLSESPKRNKLLRDSSFQSDSSHCSSVESLLESRKPDPEAILINLGFGPVQSEDILSKIPKRFLKPSQVRGIDTEAFLRQQQLANHIHDHSVLGYRGLVGNPHIPPSMIVAKIMERFELNERNRYITDLTESRPQSAPPTPGPSQ